MASIAHLTAVDQPDEGAESAAISVVIAEDHAMMRGILRGLLEGDEAVSVDAEAGDLVSTRQHVDRYRPDVLVLASRMPDGSSMELIEEFCKRLPGTHVVVLSSEDTPGFAQQALRAGACCFVLKDRADEDLVAAVQAAARGEEYLSEPVASRMRTLRQRAGDDRLSARENEVLRLIALGHTNVEIARQLGLSPRTVETHRAHIHGKLELSTRAELVRHALHLGLLVA